MLYSTWMYENQYSLLTTFSIDLMPMVKNQQQEEKSMTCFTSNDDIVL